eukprot:3379271-Pyramimonas_sp.AAC.1
MLRCCHSHRRWRSCARALRAANYPRARHPRGSNAGAQGARGKGRSGWKKGKELLAWGGESNGVLWKWESVTYPIHSTAPTLNGVHSVHLTPNESPIHPVSSPNLAPFSAQEQRPSFTSRSP